MRDELVDIRGRIADLLVRVDGLLAIEPEATPPAPAPAPAPAGPATAPIVELAWGSRVSETFRSRALWIGRELKFPASWLMAVMAFESGESFRADKRNGAGSGATGLIQFMPSTAKRMGTSTAELAAMTAEDQLNYVYLYFEDDAGRIRSLADLYMLVLWPAAFGKPPHYEFDWTAIQYAQNKGLDANRNGKVTKLEAAASVEAKLVKGMQAGNVWRGPMPVL